MIKRLIIAVLLLGLVAGGLVGFNLFRQKMIGEFFANMPVPSATVSTFEAKRGSWHPVIDAIGTVNALRGVNLTVETQGVIREIAFSSNQQVKEGDLLLQLDNVVLNAEVETARTQAELDRDNLVRAQELTRRGVATNVSLETQQAASRASDARLARALALLDQRQVRAPFSGTIGIPRVDVGQFISPGDVVATLQDLETMRVDFTIPEQRLPEVAIGQSLNVRVEHRDTTYVGDVKGVDPRVDPASRLVAIRGAVTNTDHALTPGQFVRIQIALPEEHDVLAVPQTAVVTSLYGDYVYVVQPKEGQADNLEVRQHFVQIGRRSGQVIEIVSGIEEGAQVVTAGQNRLNNGQPAVVDNRVNPADGVSGPAWGGASAGEPDAATEAGQ